MLSRRQVILGGAAFLSGCGGIHAVTALTPARVVVVGRSPRLSSTRAALSLSGITLGQRCGLGRATRG